MNITQSFIRKQITTLGMMKKAHFCASMIQQKTVLCPAREHTIRLFGPFCYQVINQDPNIRFVAAEN
jgi:hypothetical protein